MCFCSIYVCHLKSIDLKVFCFFPRKGMEDSIPLEKAIVFSFFFPRIRSFYFLIFFISSAVSGRKRTIAVINRVSLSPKPQELLVSSYPIQISVFFFLTRLSFEVA